MRFGKLEKYGCKELMTKPSLIINTINESNSEFNVKLNLKMCSINYSPHIVKDRFFRAI